MKLEITLSSRVLGTLVFHVRDIQVVMVMVCNSRLLNQREYNRENENKVHHVLQAAKKMSCDARKDEPSTDGQDSWRLNVGCCSNVDKVRSNYDYFVQDTVERQSYQGTAD